MNIWRKFNRHLNYAYSLLNNIGIPLNRDDKCTIGLSRPGVLQSYYDGGEIWIARRVVKQGKENTAFTIIHEATHYWCERFPRAMKKGHTFRVPKVKDPMLWAFEKLGLDYPFKTICHRMLYEKNDNFITTYSQIDSEECLCEFMAYYIVYKPDLRAVKSGLARRRFKACRRMIDRLRFEYRDIQ